MVIVCGPGPLGEKLRSVYDFNMSGPDSRTSLYVTD